jgi:hypothetical protein
MVQRSLLPDFSPAVLAQTETITGAPTRCAREIRDLRDFALLRCLIMKKFSGRRRLPPTLVHIDLIGLEERPVHLDAEAGRARELEGAVRVVEWRDDELVVLAEVPT